MGYLGSLLILVGMWFTGRKNKFGFVLGILGEFAWFVRGVQTGLLDLLILTCIFGAMHIWNYWEWSRPKRRHLLLFSKRCELARDAEQWCSENRAKPDALGFITALQALGVDLRRPQ